MEEEEEGQEGEASEGAAGTAAPEQSAAAALLPALARPFSPPRPLGSPRPYSPRGRRLSDSAIPSPWMQAQRQQMERQRSRSAGEAHCWSAMPPGFYPGAAVEVRLACYAVKPAVLWGACCAGLAALLNLLC